MNYAYKQIWLINLPIMVSLLMEQLINFTDSIFLGHVSQIDLAYIIHSGFISGYQNRYGDNLKPPTNVYHRMTA